MALNEILNRFFFCNFKVKPVDKMLKLISKSVLIKIHLYLRDYEYTQWRFYVRLWLCCKI